MVTQEAAERLLDTPRLRSDMTHLSKALGRWILHTNRLDITHQTLTHDKREKNQKVLIKDCIKETRASEYIYIERRQGIGSLFS